MDARKQQKLIHACIFGFDENATRGMGHGFEVSVSVSQAMERWGNLTGKTRCT